MREKRYLLSKNHYKAILFDLDGTLRHHLPSGGEVFVEYLRSIGVRFSEEDETRAERWEHFYFANSLEIQEDNKTFRDDSAGFWVNFSKRRLIALGLPPAQAAELAPDVSAHMEENYKPEVFVPDEARLILASLKEADYTLGVISNRSEPFHEELRELRIDSFFDFTLAGGEVQAFKPDPQIFHKGLELAGASPHETMYIGDNYFADIIGSRRAGLMPVLYDPNTLFPEADCAVIQSFSELNELLK